MKHNPLTALITTLTLAAAGTALASGSACPACLAKLEITSTSPGEGNLSRDADSTYQSWGSGSVKLACDDGTTYDAVSLSLEPYDLENGIDLQGIDLPAVDLTSSSLDCEVQVDDGSQSSIIDVDIL